MFHFPIYFFKVTQLNCNCIHSVLGNYVNYLIEEILQVLLSWNLKLFVLVSFSFFLFLFCSLKSNKLSNWFSRFFNYFNCFPLHLEYFIDTCIIALIHFMHAKSAAFKKLIFKLHLKVDSWIIPLRNFNIIYLLTIDSPLYSIRSITTHNNYSIIFQEFAFLIQLWTVSILLIFHSSFNEWEIYIKLKAFWMHSYLE